MVGLIFGVVSAALLVVIIREALLNIDRESKRGGYNAWDSVYDAQSFRKYSEQTRQREIELGYFPLPSADRVDS